MICYRQGMPISTIEDYHSFHAEADRLIFEALREEITEGLREAESKVWHAHPVWFLNGNPIVGYSKLKSCVRLFFWSGQSFPTPGLTAEGTFMAAAKRYASLCDANRQHVQTWLRDAQDIQWDYKNIVKRKGNLVRLE